MDDQDRYTRITLRIPKDLHAKLQSAADDSSKSMNAEIIARLGDSFVERKESSALAENLRIVWTDEIRQITEEASRKVLSEEIQELRKFFDQMVKKNSPHK